MIHTLRHPSSHSIGTPDPYDPDPAAEEGESEDDERVCSICLDPLHDTLTCTSSRESGHQGKKEVAGKREEEEEEEEGVTTLPGCEHAFHAECHEAWRATCAKKGWTWGCPLCRRG